jgi:hypothetical protein
MRSKRKNNEESLSLLKWKRKYWYVVKPTLYENVPTSSVFRYLEGRETYSEIYWIYKFESPLNIRSKH